MSKWLPIKLGDIADFSNGINFDKSSYCENGTYLIGVSDFGEELFPDYSTLRHIDSTIVRECNLLKDGDIVFVRSNGNKALVGRSMLIKNPPENTSFSGFCIRARIKNHESFDPLFFAYLFKSENFRKAIAGCSIGANIQNLSQGKLASYMAYVPSIEIQRKIADMLSAYDDLIENNRKQIKLLEEAAQRLYKEWFIDLRFPGYETTPIVNGVPEGWEKKPISAIAEYLNGFAFKPSDWQQEGKPIIKIKEMNQGVSDDTPRNDGANISLKYLIKSGDILFSWSATLSVMIWNHEEGWLNQHLFKVIPEKGFAREFVLQSIANTLKEFQNLTTGATMKHIQRGKLDDVFVNVPTSLVMNRFAAYTEPIRNKILILSKQIEDIQETRNRLLPKLMNGEFEVE